MTCTYYGGTTGQFTLDIARLGLVPKKDDTVAKNSYSLGGKYTSTRFFADGLRIFFCNHDYRVSPTMTLDFKGKNKYVHTAIDTNFLTRCKLFDQAVFERELKTSPSPLAMVAAIRAAKESIKPDYARTRKYGAGLADAVEGLLYHDLGTPTKDGFWKTWHTNKAIDVHFDFVGNSAINLRALTGHGVASKALNDPDYFNSGVNINYLAEMGLIDLGQYHFFETLQPKPLALQAALRWKLGVFTAGTDALDLPADAFDT
jgi:hypothetical protein